MNKELDLQLETEIEKEVPSSINHNEIDALKAEILSELRGKKKRKKIAWGSYAVTGILGILAVFSLVQAWQIASVFAQIKAGGTTTVQAADTSGGAPLPSSLENLPDMVGGC